MKARKRYTREQHPVVERMKERMEDYRPYARDMKHYYDNMDYHKKRKMKSTLGTIVALMASYKLYKKLRHH